MLRCFGGSGRESASGPTDCVLTELPHTENSGCCSLRVMKLIFAVLLHVSNSRWPEHLDASSSSIQARTDGADQPEDTSIA